MISPYGHSDDLKYFLFLESQYFYNKKQNSKKGGKTNFLVIVVSAKKMNEVSASVIFVFALCVYLNVLL